MSISKKKFDFGLRSVVFAGYKVDQTGYAPGVELTRPIREFPLPEKVSDLRSFLGLAQQLGQVKPELAERIEPLRSHLKTTKGRTRIEWTAADREAFGSLKRYLSSTSTLAFFDLKRKTRLVADASRLGLGFVLQQLHGETWKPVQCGSRVLSPAERNYAMVELEALASAWAMNKCRLFLLGLPHFELITDHRPLVSIMNQRRLDELENDRLRRIKSKTTNFAFETRWIKGVDNIVADLFSRAPMDRVRPADQLGELEESNDGKFVSVSAVAVDADGYILPPRAEDVAVENVSLKNFKEKVYADEFYMGLFKLIKEGFPAYKGEVSSRYREFWKHREALTLTKGVVAFKNNLAYIPPSLVQETVRQNHKTAHFGANKMVLYMQQFYWWPGMTVDITQFVLSCPICQVHSPAHAERADVGFPEPSRPLQYVHGDTMTYGKKNWLLLCDQETLWAYAEELHSMTGKETADQLDRFAGLFGKMDALITDGGPNFDNRWVKEWCRIAQVVQHKSIPYRPQGNGYAESTVGKVKERLKRLLEEEGITVNSHLSQSKLRWAVLKLNNAPTTRGVSPAVAMYGRPLQDSDNIFLGANLMDENSKYWKDRQARRARICKTEMLVQLRKTRNLNPIEPGEKVAVRAVGARGDGKFSIFGEVLGCDEFNRLYHVLGDNGKLIKVQRELLRVRRLAGEGEGTIGKYLGLDKVGEQASQSR